MRKLVIWVNALFLTCFTITIAIVSVSRLGIQIKPPILRVLAGEDAPSAHQLSVYEAIVDNSYEIMLFNERTNQTRQLTSHFASDRFPILSPAGDQVAFISWRDGNSEIYVIEMRTGTLRNVSNYPDRDMLPAWSPDGTLLAYVSRRGGQTDIVVADVKRGLAQNITRSPHHDTQPEWLPDGQALTFVSHRDGVPARYVFNLTRPVIIHYEPANEWQSAPNTHNMDVMYSEIPG